MLKMAVIDAVGQLLLGLVVALAATTEGLAQTPTTGDAPPTLEPQHKAVAAAVRISTPEGRFLGCGVVIRQGARELEVLTAAHLLTAAPRIEVQYFATSPQAGQLGPLVKQTNVQVIAQDPRADLARLVVKSGIPAAAVAQLPRQSIAAEQVSGLTGWVIDWTKADDIQARQVTIDRRQKARRQSAEQPVSFWVLDRLSRSGMSGGPLISSHGELIGIASGNSGQNAYYTDDRELAVFLASEK